MINSKTYRLITVVLAVVFCLFNIGLPIVVASCPMMTHPSSRGGCCQTRSPWSGESLRSTLNTSCCKTIVAAERNTNEFLQRSDYSLTTFTVATPLLVTILHQEMLRCEVATQTSPPLLHPGDIPLFTSSLLI